MARGPDKSDVLPFGAIALVRAAEGQDAGIADQVQAVASWQCNGLVLAKGLLVPSAWFFVLFLFDARRATRDTLPNWKEHTSFRNFSELRKKVDVATLHRVSQKVLKNLPLSRCPNFQMLRQYAHCRCIKDAAAIKANPS
jgi:hypothetical protein